MLATVSSASLTGVRGHPVTVEVHVSQGLPSFTVVGLPDTSCREARDRVRAAVLSSGLEWPQTRITVNLAPSGVPKVGAGLDLAIAVGVLRAGGQLGDGDTEGFAFIGELGLDGSVRNVIGTLPLVAAARRPIVAVAPANHAEAALVPGVDVRSAPTLRAMVDALRAVEYWPQPPPAPIPPAPAPLDELAQVKGQPLARRAVEIAAAGGHHLLMVGPPGGGKSMLARSLVGLLPSLTPEEALDVMTVHSAAGLQLAPGALIERPPFRAPHHTASTVALVGGGSRALRPGEISCAHAGVLFLDELGEFPASVLDALRQPLEDGVVRIARAYGATTLPARVLLVAAMNPCPCGDAGVAGSSCRCSEGTRQRYLRRVSGPLLDRFDLRVHVDRPPASALFSSEATEPTAAVVERVAQARSIAAARGVARNADLAMSDLDTLAPLAPTARRVLEIAMDRGRLTARGVHRVRRVARTIADLAGTEGPVDECHVAGALATRIDVGTSATGLVA